MSDMVDRIDIVADLEQRVADLECRLANANLSIQRDAVDASILLPLAQEFIVRALERGDHDAIRSALQAIIDDTGIEPDDIAESLHRQGVLSDASEYMNRTFFVSITVPVTVNVEVEARDYAHAEDLARDEVEMNGLDSYYQDIDWYRVDYYVEEA